MAQRVNRLLNFGW